MKSFFGKLIAAAVCLCMAMGVQAQTSSINVVTTAVPFLRISPDARAGGMGDLGVATSPDANSQFYNLAKYPFSSSKGSVALTYTPWLKDLGLNDVYLATLAGYYKLDDVQAVSGSLRYFSLGNIQFTDNFGNDIRVDNSWETGRALGEGVVDEDRSIFFYFSDERWFDKEAAVGKEGEDARHLQ